MTAEREIQQGKLYTFFLGIANTVLYEKVHQEKQVPEDGTSMYNQLKLRLEMLYNKEYKDVIDNCNYLQPYQKRNLYPTGGTLNTYALDFVMYMKIFKLLGGYMEHPLIKYLEMLRNDICHISIKTLQSNRSQKEFEELIYSIEMHLQYYGVSSDLVNKYKSKIIPEKACKSCQTEDVFVDFSSM